MEKELHEKMKFAWKSMNLLKDDLDLETTDLKCSFGNYVKINGEWKKQNYPIPTFFIKNIGEVGYDFDTFYLVVAVQKTSIKEEFIKDLLEMGYNISIYGAKNFMEELLDAMSPRKTFQNVERFDEETIQIEFDFSENEIKDFQNIVETICSLFKKYRIKIVS